MNIPKALLEPVGPTPVDPALYATSLFEGGGVDFDSANHNIHCGIFLLGEGRVPGGEPNAVCRATNATYEVDPPSDPTGNIGYDGGRLYLDGPAGPNKNSGGVAAGEGYPDVVVGVLEPGFSIAFGGFICTSPDEDSIECVRDSDGAGFMVGGTSYRYF